MRGRRTSEGSYYDVAAPSAMIRLEAEHRMQNGRMQESQYIRSVCVCVCVCVDGCLLHMCIREDLLEDGTL